MVSSARASEAGSREGIAPQATQGACRREVAQATAGLAVIAVFSSDGRDSALPIGAIVPGRGFVDVEIRPTIAEFISPRFSRWVTEDVMPRLARGAGVRIVLA